MTDLPDFRPDMTFDQACRAALEFLAVTVPMGYWSVSRQVAGQQLYLEVVDDAYGKVAGDSHLWSESLCQHMVTGSAPQIAPDAMAVPPYAAAGVARALTIGSYIGIPIQTADGEVFGTLCGLDPAVKNAELFAEAGTLRQIGTLLAGFLDTDLAVTQAARESELAPAVRARFAREETAARLVTQSFWEATLAREAPRLKRFGDCAAVVAVAVDPSEAAGAARTLAAKTRSSDVVATLSAGGFGILARDIKPTDSPGLVSRIRTAMAEAGVAASLSHRDISIKEGLAGAWQEASTLIGPPAVSRADPILLASSAGPPAQP